jgi:phage head maturation protease
MENQTFNYEISEGFLWSEVTLKGSKEYYVEGYASTIDEDLSGEIVGMEAQERLLAQIKANNITLDVEHSEWYDDNGNVLPKPKNTTIPVAKVVSAELRERGVWVKAKINPHIPSFRSIWNSIKDGFLKAFSIAFYPVAKAGKVISDLNLVNITLTGSPVNTGATFNAVMKSAKAYLDSQKKKENLEEEKMTEEIKEKVEAQPVVEEKENIDVQPEEPKVEEPKVEDVNPLEADVKALKEQVAKQDEVIAKLKAELEKPVMKAIQEQAPGVPKEEQIFISPLKMVK